MRNRLRLQQRALERVGGANVRFLGARANGKRYSRPGDDHARVTGDLALLDQIIDQGEA